MSKDDRISVTCPNCGKEFFVVRNTSRCPHCDIDLKEDVEVLFSKLDTNLANNKVYQGSKSARKVGESVQETGSCLQSLGCTIFLLPIALISLLFLLTMCGASF